MSAFEWDASAPPVLDDIGVNLPAPADFSTALAEGFARRIGTLARRGGASAESVKWAARAAFAASRATAEGHVCLPLAVLARRFDAASAEVRAALFASGMASDGSPDAAALRPLVIDGQGRLYLARYYDYERRLARSLVAHAGGGISGGGYPEAQMDAGEGGNADASANSHAGADADGRLAAGTEAGAGAEADADAGARAAAGANGDTTAQTLHTRLLRYFGPPQDDEVDWQRVAAVMALSGRLTIVSGGVLVLLWEGVHGRSPRAALGAYQVTTSTHYSVASVLRWLVYHLGELDLYVGVVPFAALLFLLTTRERRSPLVHRLITKLVPSAATMWFAVDLPPPS